MGGLQQSSAAASPVFGQVPADFISIEKILEKNLS
jgi:hypothetical protein